MWSSNLLSILPASFPFSIDGCSGLHRKASYPREISGRLVLSRTCTEFLVYVSLAVLQHNGSLSLLTPACLCSWRLFGLRSPCQAAVSSLSLRFNVLLNFMIRYHFCNDIARLWNTCAVDRAVLVMRSIVVMTLRIRSRTLVFGPSSFNQPWWVIGHCR